MSPHLVMCLLFCLTSHQIEPTVQPAEYVNVALGKPTVQTSGTDLGDSSKAVDGNRESQYSAGSCSHTWSGQNNFWVVDLLRSHPIRSVAITNRDIGFERLTDFYIYISKANPYSTLTKTLEIIGDLCLSYPGSLPAHGPHSLDCDSQDIHGRYVYLWKPKHDVLTLCEFEVPVEKNQLGWNPIQMGFFVFSGRKSTRPPFFSIKMERSSLMNCVGLCLSAEEGYTTVVQVEKTTKRCECIQESGLEESVTEIIDVGWTLMRSTRN